MTRHPLGPQAAGLVATVGVWLVLAVPIAVWFASSSEGGIEPYMDEVFHIPQAQRYCAGDWAHWDSKITTFPGLYLSAVPLAKFLGSPFGDGSCSVAALRAVNVLYGAGCVAALYLLRLRKAARAAATPATTAAAPAAVSYSTAFSAAAHAAMIALYPVHFFFTFLFYTDVGSVFWILLATLLASAPLPSRRFGREEQRPLVPLWRVAAGACAGGAAILLRQTNVVWVLFVFGTACLAELSAASDGALRFRPKRTAGNRSGPGNGATDHSTASGKDVGKKGEEKAAAAAAAAAAVPFGQELWWFAWALVGDAPRLLSPIGSFCPLLGIPWLRWAVARPNRQRDRRRGTGGGGGGEDPDDADSGDAGHGEGGRPGCGLGLLLVPVAAFAAFVVGWNGGSIVVGDHENHAAQLFTPHWAQLAYLSVATALPFLPFASDDGGDDGGGGGGGSGGDDDGRNSGGRGKFALFLANRADLSDLFVACAGVPPPAWLSPFRAAATSLPTKASPKASSPATPPAASAAVGPLSRAAAAVAMAAHALRHYSLAHPFLVADNRHFPFYLWRRVLDRYPDRPWLRACLAPAYLALARLIAVRLTRRARASAPASPPPPPPPPPQQQQQQQQQQRRRRQQRHLTDDGSSSAGGGGRGGGGGEGGVPRLWLLIWGVAAALVLVPSPLLEPRYFTTAVVLAHAHAPLRSTHSVAATAAAFATCNAAVLAIFVLRPFVWGDGTIARFMW